MEGTVLLKVRVVDLMARVLTEQIQTTVAHAVLAEALPPPTFLRHSLGSEGMVVSIVVMVEEAVMNRNILTHDPVRQAMAEVSALAGLVEERCTGPKATTHVRPCRVSALFAGSQ